MSSETPPAEPVPDPATYDDAESVIEALRATQDVKQKLRLAIRLADFEPDAARPVISMLDPSAVDTKAAVELKVGDRVFPPAIAYAVFPADLIRGYNAPKLVVEFDAVSLLPFVHFEAKEKVDVDAPDAVALLREFMPADTVYEDRNAWESQRQAERANLPFANTRPVLDLGKYSVWRLKYDSVSTAYMRRVFVFSWFFIEGSRVADEEDKTWDFFVVTTKDSHEFVGYVSVYAFLYYGSGQQFEDDGREGRCTRKRIAHFVLLPPYQRHGLGSQVYIELVHYLVQDPLVKEVEVEDPSSPFELLRDRTHWNWLSNDPDAAEWLNQYDEDPSTVLEQLVQRYKLAPVQLQRVAEMYIYKASDFKETRALKQLIKSRLWSRNYEALRDMDPATQRERLQDAYEGVLHTHRRALGLENDDDEDEVDADAQADERVEDLIASFAAGESTEITKNALDEPNDSGLSPPPKRPRQK